MTATSHDSATRWFLLLVTCAVMLYVAMGLTPSSYGIVLDRLGVEGAGPIAGTARDIRSDEWALETPQFQAAVRIHFQRYNSTSFYHEDLRNFSPLPLKDWSLIFKPQMWAFFVLPPGEAFSIYYAFFAWMFVVGLYLVFREMQAPAVLAIAATVMVYFSGFSQFWCTSFQPALASFVWVLLLTLRPMKWWKKALLGVWVFPFFVLSHIYPPLLLTLGWCTLFVVCALRPGLFRLPGELAALAISVAAAGIAVYVYLADVIPVMRQTVYPGQRLSLPGTTPWQAALGQIYPFFSFQLRGFEHLCGENICENSAVGSFLPLLTLCTTRWREVRSRPTVVRALAVLFGGFAAVSLWQLTPVPTWIGHALVWDTSTSRRWLFTSGFLVTAAMLVLWREGLVSLTVRRVALFLVVGPVASIVLKFLWLSTDALNLSEIVSQNLLEIEAVGLAAVTVIILWPKDTARRTIVLLSAMALLNVYAFGRFNPLQPGRPIFEIPETPVMQQLRATAAASPGNLLVDGSYLGNILNGLGFRSVDQYVLEPATGIFRGYFPTMPANRFNFVFNRSSHIQLMDGPVPDVISCCQIGVPIEVFRPIRNVRHVEIGTAGKEACAGAATGGVNKVEERGATLAIDGWAPWRGEDAGDGIRVLSARALRAAPIVTVTRPDIAEQIHDYHFVKAGFHLEVSSVDGKDLHPNDVVLVAYGNLLKPSRLPCCGCP